MCYRHGRLRAGDVFIEKKRAEAASLHVVLPLALPNPSVSIDGGVVFCASWVISLTMVVLLVFYFVRLISFFLICTWTLTFYGLKSTDWKTLHRVHLCCESQVD